MDLLIWGLGTVAIVVVSQFIDVPLDLMLLLLGAIAFVAFLGVV